MAYGISDGHPKMCSHAKCVDRFVDNMDELVFDGNCQKAICQEAKSDTGRTAQKACRQSAPTKCIGRNEE